MTLRTLRPLRDGLPLLTLFVVLNLHFELREDELWVVLPTVGRAMVSTLGLLGLAAPLGWISGALLASVLPTLRGLDGPLQALGAALRALPVFTAGLLLMRGEVAEGAPHALLLPALALSIPVAGGVLRRSRAGLRELTDTGRCLSATLRPLRIGLPRLLPRLWSQTSLLTFLGEALIIEVVFGRAGLGRLTVAAAFGEDAPMLAGAALGFALLVALGQAARALLRALLSPSFSPLFSRPRP